MSRQNMTQRLDRDNFQEQHEWTEMTEWYFGDIRNEKAASWKGL